MLKELFKRNRVQTPGTILTESELETAFLEEPDMSAPVRKIRERGNPSEILKQTFEFLKEHQGEVITGRRLADHFGYKHENSVYQYINTLIKRGAITREGGHFHPTYKVNRTRINGASKRATPAPKKVVEAPAEVKPVMSKPVSKLNKALQAQTERGTQQRAKVYRYIEAHQGDFIPMNKMAQAVGGGVSPTRRHVESLVRSGVIEASGVVSGLGTRYRVAGNTDIPVSATAPRVVPAPAPVPNTTKQNQVFCDRLEELAQEFVREERDTNVLKMVDWLKKKG